MSKILKEMFSLGFLLKDFLRISLISLMYRFIEILDLKDLFMRNFDFKRTG